jgi:TBC1 domain family member 20
LDLEPLITAAIRLFANHPPDRLPGRVWNKISSSSALKTARSKRKPISYVEAEACFKRQAAEVRWEETIEKAGRMVYRYRRPIATTMAAVAVGAFSFWLRRSGSDRYILSLVFSLLGATK